MRGGQGLAAHSLEQRTHDKALSRTQRTDVEPKVENRMGTPASEAGAEAAAAFVSELAAVCAEVGCCIHREHSSQRQGCRQLGESDDLTARIRLNRIGVFAYSLTPVGHACHVSRGQRSLGDFSPPKH